MRIQKTFKAGLLFASLLSANAVFSQTDDLGGWYMANINYRFNKKFAVFAEIQARAQNVTNNFFYHEVKGGLLHYLGENSVFVGFGNYKTYTIPGNFKDPLVINEYRLWEQFVLKNNINRVKIEHRYRIEQRWQNGKFANRFRYRLNPILPLNHKTVIPNTVFLTAFEELFFSDKPPYFRRSRFFVGAGYQFTKLFSMQAGYISQYENMAIPEDSYTKNFLHASFLFSIDKSETKREAHPSIMD